MSVYIPARADEKIRQYPLAEPESEAIAVEAMLQSSALADRLLLAMPLEAVRDEINQSLYQAVAVLRENHIPIDIVTLTRQLRRNGSALSPDGISAILRRSKQIDPVAASYHARIVYEAFIRQRIREAADQMMTMAHSYLTPDEILAQSAQLLQACQMGVAQSALIPIRQTMDEYKKRLRQGIAMGVSTGYRDLDQILGGLHCKDLIVLAARPGVGKTTLGLNLCYNAASSGCAVFVASQEMGHEQLGDSLIASRSQVDRQWVRFGILDSEEAYRYIEHIADQLGDLPIDFYDKAAIQISDLRLRVGQWRAAHPGHVLLIVDYLQLMRGDKRTRDGRVQEVAEISGGLKAIAKDFNMPVLALSQLNRAVEGRQVHIPVLADLRDSGSIEQDADIVLFIHREELYDQETDKKGIAEIHIAKHRGGPLGVVPMRFNASISQFSDLTYRTPDGY